mgnify:CR=1 FL=1
MQCRRDLCRTDRPDRHNERRHRRRTARQQEADARHARAELADLREQSRMAAARTGGQVPALKPGLTPQYLAIGRDKQGATL